MSDQEHRAALAPGARVQWYEIRKVLGQGGFGITYLALDTNLDQEVAVKEYLPMDLAVRDHDRTVHPASRQHGEQFKWGLERFIEEAKTLARFKHPNIVRVYSVFEANNTAYMVMEYERGESLQDMVSGRRTLDETALLKVILPLLQGLEQVHAAGFIHRDIKPPNIFLREDGTPVLLDFGSARQAIGQRTRTLTAMVSPGYAPFEQYTSKSDEQGPWTDIYGLAATMYRAVSGRAPMDAVDRSRVLLDKDRDPLVTASEIGAGTYSERLLRAIDHGLAFRVKDRPQTIAAWRAEFEGEEDPREMRTVEAFQEAPTVAVAPAPPAAEPRPRRVGLYAGVLVIALAAAAGGYLAWRTFGERAHVAGGSQAAGAPAAAAAANANQAAAEQKAREEAAAKAKAEAEAKAREEAAAKAKAAAEAKAREEAAAKAKAAAEAKAREEAAAKAKAAAEAKARAEAAAKAKAAAEAKAREEAAAKAKAAAEAKAKAAAEAKARAVAAAKAEAQAKAKAERTAAINACEAKKRQGVSEPSRVHSATPYFAVIAVGKNHGWGEAYGYTTHAEADRVAMDNCKAHDSGCEVKVWSNDCVAIAEGVDDAAGWAWGATLPEAASKAIGYCEQHSPCCSVASGFCADERAR